MGEARLMAKKKAGGDRSPKNKERKDLTSAKVIAFRCSADYSGWVEGLAEKERDTLAGIIDRALVVLAQEVGYTPEPPKRI